MNLLKLAKIVATVGPACQTEEKLEQLILAGVNVFRLNFSHGSFDEHKAAIEKIRTVSKKIDREVCIMMDLQGPKIRVGEVENSEGIYLEKGSKLTITINPCIGKNYKVSTVYRNFVQDVNVGDVILIDDGQIKLRAVEKRESEIDFEALNSNFIKSKKGINLPGIKLSTPALTEKDEADLRFGLANDIDAVALSFVRDSKDLDHLFEIMDEEGKSIPVISKIEKPEAIKDIEQIVDKSFGVMIARGDLGIEIESEKLPILQKKITSLCNQKSKPVIIATQMLDSMIRNPIATRAEITDIANALLDGADALMLSGETAVGDYPIESVKTMTNVINEIEGEYFRSPSFKKHITDSFRVEQIDENICNSAVNIARNMKAKALVCVTHTGSTVKQIAKYRPYIPILVATSHRKTIRIMNFVWGTEPLQIESFDKLSVNFQYLQELLEESGAYKPGDKVVITAGTPTFKHNTTNCIKVYEVKGNKQ